MAASMLAAYEQLMVPSFILFSCLCTKGMDRPCCKWVQNWKPPFEIISNMQEKLKLKQNTLLLIY